MLRNSHPVEQGDAAEQQDPHSNEAARPAAAGAPPAHPSPPPASSSHQRRRTRLQHSGRTKQGLASNCCPGLLQTAYKDPPLLFATSAPGTTHRVACSHSTRPPQRQRRRTSHVCAALQERIPLALAALEARPQLLPQLLVGQGGAGVANDGHIARQEAGGRTQNVQRAVRARGAATPGEHRAPGGSARTSSAPAQRAPGAASRTGHRAHPCWNRNCSAGYVFLPARSPDAPAASEEGGGRLSAGGRRHAATCLRKRAAHSRAATDRRHRARISSATAGHLSRHRNLRAPHPPTRHHNREAQLALDAAVPAVALRQQARLALQREGGHSV